MPSPEARAAASALRLRDWALRLFAGLPAGAAPAAGPEAWSTFLTVDRCALPLREALAGGALDALSPDAREALQEQAVVETRRVLGLRAEAARVGALLSARGWEGIALKGGAAVLAGAATVDVQDLDVLVRPEHALELAHALDAAGFQAIGDDLPVGSAARHELSGRRAPGGLIVEVHHDLAPTSERIDAWEGTEPLPARGLRRMSGPNHLWHVLTHGTLHHPERRGALRDLLVAAAAVRLCTPAQVDAARARAATHPRGRPIGQMLEAAAALAAGRLPADALRREAATAYLVYGKMARWKPGAHLLLSFGRAAFALAAGGGEYRRLWVGTPVSVVHRGYTGSSALDRRIPALATLGRTLLRAGSVLAATVPAVGVARTARKLASTPAE